jgi:hypothetical protein
VVRNAAAALGNFGSAAKQSLPELVAVLADGPEKWWAVLAIQEIGIDRDSAEAISALTFDDDHHLGQWLLGPLCDYPDAAVTFLSRNPQAADVPVKDYEDVLGTMRSGDPRSQPLREALYESEHLPLTIMARLRDPRFLPSLNDRIKSADPHKKTRLEACARACGRASKRVVRISESQPGNFKPASAWPRTDRRRQSPEPSLHGDGYTEVIITGRILSDDGRPTEAPKFFRTNDAMLLGERVREELPVEYDQQTGRFVLCTRVFAAYCAGKGQPEPGPYQTGSCLTLIEADGCKPLVVQFYDEMPDVEITLKADRN